jgi:hypothetical protein
MFAFLVCDSRMDSPMESKCAPVSPTGEKLPSGEKLLAKHFLYFLSTSFLLSLYFLSTFSLTNSDSDLACWAWLNIDRWLMGTGRQTVVSEWSRGVCRDHFHLVGPFAMVLFLAGQSQSDVWMCTVAKEQLFASNSSFDRLSKSHRTHVHWTFAMQFERRSRVLFWCFFCQSATYERGWEERKICKQKKSRHHTPTHSHLPILAVLRILTHLSRIVKDG